MPVVLSGALCLPAVPADYDGPFVASYSVMSMVPACECAGLAFFERVEVHRRAKSLDSHGSNAVGQTASAASVAGSTSESATGPAGAPGSAEVADERKKKNYKANSSISQRVSQALERGDDLYEFIFLPKSATCEEVRKQWRRLALVLHPDKTATGGSAAQAEFPGLPDLSKLSPEALNEEFLKRHNAFEILVDPVQKRQYDSYAEFDDRLPEEHEIIAASLKGPAEWFKLCAPAFTKESRWCVKQPVPELGDMETPIDQVKAFYKYWSTYESWRDFGNAGEHNLEDAHDREERKWMQKENWKVVKSMLKNERLRVLRFVHAAEAKDPRILLHREKSRPATTAAGRTQAAAASSGPAARPTTAAAKAKAMAEMKASILARRKKLTDGRTATRQIVKEWFTEKLGNIDLDFQKRVEAFLAKDQNVNEISDLAHKMLNHAKRYKEPTREGASDLKSLINNTITATS